MNSDDLSVIADRLLLVICAAVILLYAIGAIH